MCEYINMRERERERDLNIPIVMYVLYLVISLLVCNRSSNINIQN